MSAEAVEMEQKDFAVHLEQGDGQSALVSIRWCLTPQGLDRLKEKNARRPHILIFVLQHKSYPKPTFDGRQESIDEISLVSRDIFPIEQGRTYVSFPRHGVFTIHAVVVWSVSPFPGIAWGELAVLRHNPSLEDGENIRWPNKNILAGCGLETLDTFDTRWSSPEILVGEEFFAKPGRFAEWFATLVWKKANFPDQCALRGRVMKTAAVLPFLLPLASVILTLVMIVQSVFVLYALLVGKHIQWREFGRSGEFDDITDVIGKKRRWIWKEADGKDRRLHSVLLRLPLVYTLLAGIGGISAFYPEAILGVLKFGGIVVLAVIALLLVVAFVYERIENAYNNSLTLAQSVVCTEDSAIAPPRRPVSLRHRMVLRYLDTKAKVCKPMARP